MEEKIKIKCEEFDIDPNVLTEEEKAQLIQEIKAEEKGNVVLDGILSNPEIRRRCW
jgi:hypothetical protein